MIIIGIDPGTATTGYGIFKEDPTGKISVINYGTILTDPCETIEKRLKYIYQEISQIIHLHRPDSGAVEKLFFQKNVTNAIAVGQARGVMLLALANAGITVAEYTPNEVKQSVTGYGSAEKKQVQQMVKTLLDLPELPRPDDAADALAVAICHLHATGYERLVKNKD
jgi:crossover junction endodeoxyribonuclease RuvC